MSDDIRAFSEELAADPSSLAFLPLGELLRKRGELELAFRVATRGMQRHAGRPDGHGLVARIALDRGDAQRARAEWLTVLALDPGNAEAHKGLGFLHFQQGELDEAARYLTAALAANSSDPSLVAALTTVRAAAATAVPRVVAPVRRPVGTPPVAQMDAPPWPPNSPVDARDLFSDVLGDPEQTALLLDGDGYVVAGHHLASDGVDASAEMGAHLSGVTEEADRAVRHLGLGRWRQIVFEAEGASVAMAPSGSGVLLVAAPRTAPLGLVRRTLERALERATRWLERGT